MSTLVHSLPLVSPAPASASGRRMKTFVPRIRMSIPTSPNIGSCIEYVASPRALR